MCSQISSGVIAIIGPQDPLLGLHIQSLCDTLDIPHLEYRVQHLAESSQNPTSTGSSTVMMPSSSQVNPFFAASIPSNLSVSHQSMHSMTSSSLSGIMMPSSSLTTSGKEFSINLHPTSKAGSDALRELIVYLNWTEVAIIYEDDISLIFLQELVRPPPLPKDVKFVFRQSTPESFRETLNDIKARSIYSMIVDVKPESIPNFITAVSITN